MIGSNTSHPERMRYNYQQILEPHGVDMYNQNQLKQETEKELKQMQNRIKLLQQQETKIKKRNDLQMKKIDDMRKLREAAQREKDMQEARRRA